MVDHGWFGSGITQPVQSEEWSAMIQRRLL